VDDHSRLACSEVLSDEKGPTCAAFLDRAARYFAGHGITRIERIMTDNAWAHRWSLREVVARLGARQVFIKPHCPWQNGKVCEDWAVVPRRLGSDPGQGVTTVSCVRFVGPGRCGAVVRAGRTDLT
jgi:transposase InsO family protein